MDPSGTLHSLVHGDTIGRLWSANLSLRNVRVSEVHAMVASRRGRLCLLALRGSLSIDAQPLAEIVLQAGQTIALVPGLALQVVEVVQASSRPTLQLDGRQEVPLDGVMSILGGADPQIVRGWRPGATCRAWCSAGAAFRTTQTATVPLADGDCWSVQGTHVRFVMKPCLGSRTEPGGFGPRSLALFSNYDNVQVWSPGSTTPLILAGHSARLLSELIAAPEGVHWEEVSIQLWPGVDGPVARRRWDIQLTRLRRRLQEYAGRGDIVHSDGTGKVGLALRPGDRIEDRS